MFIYVYYLNLFTPFPYIEPKPMWGFLFDIDVYMG